jgi:YYY domain-containing protein
MWIVTILNLWDYGQVHIVLLISSLTIIQFICMKPKVISDCWKWVQDNKILIIYIELLFICSFLACSLLIAQNPAIELTEKPMDFMILNSIMSLGNIPPDDLWLASYHINYYYFGHFLIGVIGTLLNTPPALTYNLGLVLIFATSSTVLYGIAYNVLQLTRTKRPYILSLIPPVIILTLGNQLGILEFLRSINLYSERFSNWISIESLSYIADKPFSLFPIEPSWWWRSSRVINTFDQNGVSLDYTITEFPLFSFLIGDLHAHLLSAPFLLLVLYPIMILMNSPATRRMSIRKEIRKILLVSSFFIAISALINPWNLPFSLVLLGATLVYYLGKENKFRPMLIINASMYIAIVLGIVACMVLPFIWNYESTNAAISLNTFSNTRFSHLLLVNGTWIVGSLIAYGYSIKSLKAYLKMITPVEWIVPLFLSLTPLMVWALLMPFSKEDVVSLNTIFSKLILTLPISVLSAISLFIAFNPTKLRINNSIICFSHILIGIGYFILSISELFFVVDIFNNRMNTMFKFYYQAWFFLGIGVSLLLINIIQSYSASKPKYHMGINLLLVFCVLIGPAYYSIALIANHDWSNPKQLTMDGSSFLKNNRTHEYDTISWLKNQPSQIIAESYGEDYSEHGRLSSFSAHKSVLTWPGHQIQWRNNLMLINERQIDLDQLYTTEDTNLMDAVVDKYYISMIAVGPLERAIYGTQVDKTFDGHLTLYYSNQAFKIYGTKYYDSVK